MCNNLDELSVRRLLMNIQGGGSQANNSDLRAQQDLLNEQLEKQEKDEQAELSDEEKAELEAEIAELERQAGLR